MTSPVAEPRLPARATWVTATVTLLLLLPLPDSFANLGRGELFEIGKDKFAHFALFALLAWAWLAAVGRRSSEPVRRDVSALSSAAGVALFALLVAWGGAIELAQGWTGWRRGEWSDLAADALGVASGYAAHALRGRRERSAPPSG